MRGQRLCVGALIVLSMGAFCGSGLAGESPVSETDDPFRSLKNQKLGPGWLDIGGSVRLRWEYLDNFDVRRYGTRSDDDVLLARERLWADYHFSEEAHAFLMLQDSRFWCSDLSVSDFPGACPYYDSLDLREAFLEWEHISGSPWGFKAGRQSVCYGDNRVFGPGEWGNVGRYVWDAAKIYYDVDAVKIDVIFGQRVEFDPHCFDDHHWDFDAWAVYAQLKRLPPTLKTLDLFWILRHDDHNTTAGESGAGDRKTHTLGTHFDGRVAQHWDYGGALAVQRGKWGNDDIDAYGLNLRGGYTCDAPWQPRLGLEYSCASGDSDPSDGEHETFDNAFGAVDKYYGRMNMFAWMNLEDYQATVSVKPCRNAKIALDYHFFRLASDKDAWYYCSGKAQRRDTSGASGSGLGQEIDLTARWQMNRNMELQAGVSHFFPGSFVRNTGSDGGATWAFMQVSYTF